MNGLTAGAASADITPPPGMELGGYPHFPRRNTGAHDRLYASALYLESGEERLAVVSLDLLFFSRAHVLKVGRAVRETCGIPEDHLMVSCTHTHSGPWASGRLDLEALESGVKQDEGYVELLIRTIVACVAEAQKAAFPAELGYAAAPCGAERGVGGNRRDRNGPCDPFAYVLAVRDGEKAVRAVLVNYALHPTVLHEDSTLVSADYPGYVRARLNARFPGVVAMFTQGASGNQSTRYFRQGQSFAEAERVGNAIGDAAAEAMGGMRFSSSARLGAAICELPLELRGLPGRGELEARAAAAEREYKDLVARNAPYLDVQNANLRLLGAEDILGYVKIFERGGHIELIDEEQPARVQVMRIGGAAVAGLPGEVFVEYGLDLRSRIKCDMLLVHTLANGCLPGYACTEEAYAEGGYEADTSLLAPGFGRRMTDAAAALADGLG